MMGVVEVGVSLALVVVGFIAWWGLRPPKPRREKEKPAVDEEATFTGSVGGDGGDDDGP